MQGYLAYYCTHVFQERSNRQATGITIVVQGGIQYVMQGDHTTLVAYFALCFFQFE